IKHVHAQLGRETWKAANLDTQERRPSGVSTRTWGYTCLHVNTYPRGRAHTDVNIDVNIIEDNRDMWSRAW
ncbi:MAG: hypothetical protein K6T83_24005, partial [Alicyclobacillus sp.]|nr:hypothetical protein [Alicyclobacillus sp.]